MIAQVFAHLGQSTLLAGMVGLFALILRKNQARIRFWLWFAASVKFLVPFSLLVSLGSQFEWRTPPAAVRPAISFVADVASGPVFQASFPTAVPTSDRWPAVLFTAWCLGFLGVLVTW